MTSPRDDSTGPLYDRVLARRLLAYLRPYWPAVVVSVVLLIGLSAIRLIPPYLVKIVIDDVIPDRDSQQLTSIGLALLAVLLVQFGLGFLQTYLTNWTGQRIMYDLRLKIYTHIQRLDISYFDRNPVGRIMTRLTNDVDVLNELFTAGVVSIFGDIFSLVGIVAVMLWINWQLAFVCFSVIPLLFLATVIFKRKVRGSYRRVRAALARINTFLQENLTGMSVVQIYVQEERKLGEFQDRNREHTQANLDSILYYAIFYPVVNLIGALALGLILWYGGVQVLEGAITLGAVVAFIQYSERFYKPISDLSEKFNILQSAMASSERIFSILDTPVEISTPQPQVPPEKDGRIEFRNVHFSYVEGTPVLKNISFTIEPGEKVAIVGATGSGKTTLINLLTRFYDVSDGTILVDGLDVRGWDPKRLRSSIAVVLQDAFLFSGSIGQNIRLWSRDVSTRKMKEASQRIGADRFIGRTVDGYDTALTERGQSLSGGQRQLVAFARALAREPHILVMDEATSSVDTHQEEQIQAALEHLIQGRTALIIAHRLSTIHHCTRILVFHNGELREQGSHESLLAKQGIYHKLYQLQYKDQLETSASPVHAGREASPGSASE